MFGKIIPVYLDTSCAIKLFFENEQGSAKLKDYIEDLGSVSFLSSNLIGLEYQSALRRKFKDKVITKSLYNEIYRIWEDFEKRMLQKPITNSILEEAKIILLNTKVKGRVRSLDCIHFATFKKFQEAFPKIVLLSADSTLCDLAKEARLNYFNPV